MNRVFDVAVVGVSSLVGEALLSLLEEMDFPVGTLYPLDTAGEAGGRVAFRERQLRVADVAGFDFAKVQLAFFCAAPAVAEVQVPRATAAGCLVIDDSGLFRMEPTVPLVVAEVNPEALAGWRQRHIVANPNASTILMLIALKPIDDAVGIERINVVTYQAVSGAERDGVGELARQTTDLLNLRPVENRVFSRQIAFNVIPQIGPLQANGYTLEEMKMAWETHKILGNRAIGVNATAVRVPVFHGHAMALHIETRDKITASAVTELLQGVPGVRVAESVPTPVTEASGENGVYVGRIREDISHPRGIDLWIVGDNVRKGGALNCIQVAQILVKGYM